MGNSHSNKRNGIQGFCCSHKPERSITQDTSSSDRSVTIKKRRKCHSITSIENHSRYITTLAIDKVTVEDIEDILKNNDMAPAFRRARDETTNSYESWSDFSMVN